MQATIKTTIRIRKDLFDKSRHLAVEKGTSFQEIINKTLAIGFGKVIDLERNRKSMNKIDKLRNILDSKKISSKDLFQESKSDLK